MTGSRRIARVVVPRPVIWLLGAALAAGLGTGGGNAARAAGPAVAVARATPAASAKPAPVKPVALPPVLETAASEAPPKVYLFRGALGPFFSTGIDRLAEKIEQAGFYVRVYEFTLCDLIALQVEKNYREQPGPIVLMGHSMGGLCSVRIAIKLQEERIPVSLVVTIDPAHATKSVPLNVQRFINIFLSDNILGGGDVRAEPGYRGHYASFDMKDHDEVTHINIEKMDDVHAQLVTMIAQLAQTPATGVADPVPLRYLIPPKASLELWDSGIPLFVRPGETLEQIATAYHVPLWALQQSNQGAGSAPLIPGERIVIPRHLLPPAAVSAPQASTNAGPMPAQPGDRNGMIIGTRRR
jgi:predicted alpha/beta-hydrolase family hydrolase